MKIDLRCLPGWETHLPKPVLARSHLPDWLKAMPREAPSGVLGGMMVRTLKQCPPFIDAMRAGLLFPLIADLHVADGQFTWDGGLPASPVSRLTRSPIGVHVPEQTAGAPFHDPDAFAVKFTNAWTVTLPEGWSLLIQHPINREDLPFRTLAGWVDAYPGGMIHFPALWTAPGFTGTLPRGTPIAQAIPVRREALDLDFGEMSDADLAQHSALQDELQSQPGLYRKRFRAGPGSTADDPETLAS